MAAKTLPLSTSLLLLLFKGTECHRRKQKCDRQQPCGHCVARNVADLCKTFRPGDDTTDVSARMKRLESLMDDGFRQLADRLDSITSQVAYQSQVQAENLNLHHHQQQQQQQQQYHHHQQSNMNGNRGEGPSSGNSRIPIDPPTGWGMGSHRSRSNGAAGGGGGDEINGDSDSENGVANDRLSPETGAFIGSASVGIKSVQTRMGLLNEVSLEPRFGCFESNACLGFSSRVFRLIFPLSLPSSAANHSIEHLRSSEDPITTFYRRCNERIRFQWTFLITFRRFTFQRKHSNPSGSFLWRGQLDQTTSTREISKTFFRSHVEIRSNLDSSKCQSLRNDDGYL